MKLRDYQSRCVDAVLEAFQSVTSTLVVLPTGCHRAGTPILLWDGRVVPVETITGYDVLLGPDGGPRQILQLVNGRGQMAEIVPTKGEPFVVNLDHILTLQRTRDHSETSRDRRYPSARREGEIVDVSVREWLTWSKSKKHLYKLFRVGADFHRAVSPLQLPPYFVGLILGDGAVAHSYTNITTGDREVVSYLRSHAHELGYKLRFERNSPKSWVIHLTSGRGSRLANYIRSVGLRGLNSGTKFVPDNYRVASRRSRLELLAGLIDTDGSLNGGCYDYISKSRQLADDVVFVARSVGLAAYIKPCDRRAQTGGGGTYYRVCISGEISQIPCRIKRKRASTRLQKKSVNRTGFTVRLLGEEEYYGFTLTGDGRYLMGDFTVTHNCGKTVVFAHVINRMRSMGRCKVLAHREELIFQARDKIEKVTGIRPDVEMASMWASERGLFGQKSPVVVSTVQTQNAGGDGEGRKARFDPDEFILVVVDEAHHATADSYRKVIDYYRQNPKLKVLGVTATPDRHDEEALGQVFGSVAFEYGIVDAIADGFLTPIRQQVVSVSDLDLSQVRTTAGDLNGADLAKVLEFEKNLHGMVAPTLEIVGDRKTLIFAASVAQAERIAEIINRHKSGAAECIFGNTEKDRRRELLRQYATGMFQFLVNVGVACLDDQAEILTSDGWVGHDKISHEHKIANWDEGRIFFDKPLAVEVRDRRPDERMVVLETKNRSIRVTDDHRMLYRTLQRGRFQVCRAHELVDRKAELPICGVSEPADIVPEQEASSGRRLSANAYALRRNGMDAASALAVASERAAFRDALRYAAPAELTDAECEFIGFWLGDGTRSKLKNGGVEYLLWQAESYPNLVGWIDALLVRIGVDSRRRIKPPRRAGGSRVIQWSLPRGTGFGPQRRRGVYRIEPYLDKDGSELLWGLNERQFACLCRGLWMADGEHGDASEPIGDQWRVCNTNRRLLDHIQAIACCRGYRANISDGVTNTDVGHRPLWRLSLSRRQSHAMTKYRLQFEDGWKPEKVWCVRSHTGFIVTRRRGTVTITGNTEGFDAPDIDVVVMGRPTESRALYAQMLGRGTRPLPGLVDGVETPDARRDAIAGSAKPHLLVLDFVGNAGRHKLIHAADILGGNYSDNIVERAKREIVRKGKDADVSEELKKAEREQREEEAKFEEAKRRTLKFGVKHTARDVNPFDVLDLVPEREPGWHRGRQPSEKMIEMLERHGIQNPERLSFVQAGQLCGEIIKRFKEKRPTFRQARLLQRYGYETKDMLMDDAKRLIDAIKANGWRRPPEEVVA